MFWSNVTRIPFFAFFLLLPHGRRSTSPGPCTLARHFKAEEICGCVPSVSLSGHQVRRFSCFHISQMYCTVNCAARANAPMSTDRRSTQKISAVFFSLFFLSRRPRNGHLTVGQQLADMSLRKCIFFVFFWKIKTKTKLDQ